jgi:GntR family transcriptional repressor for pyruvate dehydrogenase complex
MKRRSYDDDASGHEGTGQSRASDRVAEQLIALIQSERIRPGSRLAPETQLATDFGVSRTVIREAVARLRASGVLRSEQGRGTFVLTLPARTAPESWPAADDDFVGLLEFRAALESEAAGLAARRRALHQIRQLTAILDDADLSSPAAAVEADWEFHSGVARATENPYFVAALKSIGPEGLVVPLTRLEDGDATLARAWDEHRAVVRAIARGDAIAASAAMRAHLHNSLHRLEADRRPSGGRS